MLEKSRPNALSITTNLSLPELLLYSTSSEESCRNLSRQHPPRSSLTKCPITLYLLPMYSYRSAIFIYTPSPSHFCMMSLRRHNASMLSQNWKNILNVNQKWPKIDRIYIKICGARFFFRLLKHHRRFCAYSILLSVIIITRVHT